MGDGIQILIAAALCGNVVLTQALGADRVAAAPQAERHVTHALLTALVMVVAAAFAWAGARALLLTPTGTLLLPLAWVLFTIIASVVVAAATGRWLPTLDAQVRARWWLITGNSCVLAAAMQASDLHADFGTALLRSVGAAAGFVLVVVVSDALQRRVRPQAVPAAFQGLPIQLISLGLLALACSGFSRMAQI